MHTKAGLLVLLMGGVLVCAAAVAQQVYRWVDAQGNVHYSQSPPPAAVTQVKLMNVETAPPDATGAHDQQALVKSVQAKDAARQKAATQAQAEAEKKAQQQQACDAARKQLQGYMQTHRVIANASSANPTYYTGDDLVKFREQAQEQVNKVCTGS